MESAQAFLEKIEKAESPHDWGAKNGSLEDCKAYGSYEEVYNDPVSGQHFDQSVDTRRGRADSYCRRPDTCKVYWESANLGVDG